SRPGSKRRAICFTRWKRSRQVFDEPTHRLRYTMALEHTTPNGPLPGRLIDLTAEWVTASLRANGVLGEERVTAARDEGIGVGEGYMGQIARLQLSLDRVPSAAPRTLIAKLPTLDPVARAAGEVIGGFEREVRFYRELAPLVPLRVPRCYVAAMDRRPG